MTGRQPPREVIGSAETARRFGVDPRTLTKWDRQGRLKAAFTTPGGHRRYFLDEIEKMTGSAS